MFFIYIYYSQSKPYIESSDTLQPSTDTDTEHWSPSHEKFQLVKERVKFFIEDVEKEKGKDKDKHERTRSEVLRNIVQDLFQGNDGNLDLSLESAAAGNGASSSGSMDAEDEERAAAEAVAVAVAVGVDDRWSTHTGKNSKSRILLTVLVTLVTMKYFLIVLEMLFITSLLFIFSVFLCQLSSLSEFSHSHTYPLLLALTLTLAHSLTLALTFSHTLTLTLILILADAKNIKMQRTRGQERLLLMRAESIPLPLPLPPPLSEPLTVPMPSHDSHRKESSSRNSVGIKIAEVNEGLYAFLSAATDCSLRDTRDVPFLALRPSKQHQKELKGNENENENKNEDSNTLKLFVQGDSIVKNFNEVITYSYKNSQLAVLTLPSSSLQVESKVKVDLKSKSKISSTVQCSNTDECSHDGAGDSDGAGDPSRSFHTFSGVAVVSYTDVIAATLLTSDTTQPIM